MHSRSPVQPFSGRISVNILKTVAYDFFKKQQKNNLVAEISLRRETSGVADLPFALSPI